MMRAREPPVPKAAVTRVRVPMKDPVPRTISDRSVGSPLRIARPYIVMECDSATVGYFVLKK